MGVCLEHLPTEYTRPLLDAIRRYIENLMKDQYGVSFNFQKIQESLIQH